MQLQMILLWVPVILFSVVLHEYAHGRMALFWGDETAKFRGRLTLNPIPHIDLIGTIILPAILLLSHSGIMFGWAKPVPINPANFRNRRIASIWVSAAGPGANILCSICAGLLIRFLLPGQALGWLEYVQVELFFLFQIGIGLSFFNLIPIPPLDGSHIVLGLIPQSWVPGYLKAGRYAFFALLGVFAIDYLTHYNLFNMIFTPIFTPYSRFWQWVVFGHRMIAI
jgi:Zn-dependent protease